MILTVVSFTFFHDNICFFTFLRSVASSLVSLRVGTKMIPQACGYSVLINSLISLIGMEILLGLTTYCRFGRSKLLINHLQLLRFNCFTIFARTCIVAVAVNGHSWVIFSQHTKFCVIRTEIMTPFTRNRIVLNNKLATKTKLL